MARSDLILELVRAGTRGEQNLFRKTLEALVAEERAKQHHVLADRLAAYLHQEPPSSNGFRNGSNTSFFHEITPSRKLNDLVLSDIVISACKELIEEQNRSDLLRSHNLEPRHRILLAGPPGNGKTSLAEALATELAVPLYVVKYESVITSYLGETAIRLSRLFDQIRTQRCVLFFDEFDVVGKERGDAHETGEIKRVVSSLLLQIDALPSYVTVVTATNHPELLDRAVWRRFQLRLKLSPPTFEQTEEWFRRYEVRLGEKFGSSIKSITKRLNGMNFSELEQFAKDVQRRNILSLNNLQKTINECLTQWEHRYNQVALEPENNDA